MLALVIGFFSLFTGTHGESLDVRSPVVLDVTIQRAAIQHDTTKRFVQINRVLIIGNTITRDKIISRELSLKTGDIIYSEDLPNILDLDKKKLIR